MKYLIDVDGVLADFIGGYCALVREVTGRSYTISDVTDWNFTAFALTSAERRNVHERMFRPGFVENLAELPGARDGVARVERAGHAVVFVTSAWRGHPTWASERETWLYARFSNAEIVSTAHKQHISGDVLVDDKPENVREWARAFPNGAGLLWDAPYNRGAEWVSMPRVFSWGAV